MERQRTTLAALYVADDDVMLIRAMCMAASHQTLILFSPPPPPPPHQVLITESCKLLFSLAMLVSSVPDGLKTLLSSDPGRLLKLSVPGLLYCINNNVFLHVLSDVMPASFQVLLQLRVIWTGLLFRLVMGKHLSGMQWLALLVLSGGAVLTQTRGSGDDEELGAGAAGASGRNLDTALHMVALGLTLLYTLLSSLAGVYTELLLKRGGDESIHLTNVPLYTWGVIFNVGTLFVQGSTATGGFWRGWDRSGTWVVMILLVSVCVLVLRDCVCVMVPA